MTSTSRRAILAADVNVEQTRQLIQSLAPLGLRVFPAISVSQVLELLRHKVFAEAIVAVEFTCAGQPLLSRLARLPAMRDLVAIGPAGDLEAERLARESGASAYLGRPVNTESLASVLQIDTKQMNPGEVKNPTRRTTTRKGTSKYG